MKRPNLHTMHSPIETLMVAALVHNMPDLQEPARHAREYLEFLNTVTGLLNDTSPSPAKAAALLTIVESLRLDNAQPENAQLMTTLCSAMDQIRTALREEREAQARAVAAATPVESQN